MATTPNALRPAEKPPSRSELFAADWRYKTDPNTGLPKRYPETIKVQDPQTGETRHEKHPKAGQLIPKNTQGMRPKFRDIVIAAALLLLNLTPLFWIFMLLRSAYSALTRNNFKTAIALFTLALFTIGIVAVNAIGGVSAIASLPAAALVGVGAAALGIIGLIGYGIYKLYKAATSRRDAALEEINKKEAPVKFVKAELSLDRQNVNVARFCKAVSKALHTDTMLSASSIANPDPEVATQEREELQTRLTKQIDEVRKAEEASRTVLRDPNATEAQRDEATRNIHQLTSLRAQLTIRHLLAAETVNDTALAAARAELDLANRQLGAIAIEAPPVPANGVLPHPGKTYGPAWDAYAAQAPYRRQRSMYDAAQRVLAGGQAADALLEARELTRELPANADLATLAQRQRDLSTLADTIDRLTEDGGPLARDTATIARLTAQRRAVHHMLEGTVTPAIAAQRLTEDTTRSSLLGEPTARARRRASGGSHHTRRPSARSWGGGAHIEPLTGDDSSSDVSDASVSPVDGRGRDPLRTTPAPPPSAVSGPAPPPLDGGGSGHVPPTPSSVSSGGR